MEEVTILVYFVPDNLSGFSFEEDFKMKKQRTTKWIVTVAMIATLSAIMTIPAFPLPFLLPGFYKLDFSEVPVMIGAFALGPVAGIAIEAIKSVLNYLVNGTISAGVGEVAMFLIGVSYIVPATLIYYRHTTKKTALIGLLVGSVSMVITASLLNAYLLLPAYSLALNIPIDVIVGMGTAINPAIDSLAMFILLAVVPFNLIKVVSISVLVALIYKRVSGVIKSKDVEEPYEEVLD